jgi:ribosomal-protein-alanine N-acetyltransferase
VSRGLPWDVELAHGPVLLRPIRLRDGRRWQDVRRRNADWLTPWEATVPEPALDPPPTFAAMVRRLRADARAGRALPFVVTYDGELVGQLNVGGVVRGSLRTAFLGYWVDQAVAGRGVIPTSVALAVDHCLGPFGLHRVEINIRPENTASLRVVEKLGFRDEGVRRRYLHIDGAWRDHRTFAMTVEDLPPGGLLARWDAQTKNR